MHFQFKNNESIFTFMFHFPVVAFRKELLHSVTDPQTKTEKEKKGKQNWNSSLEKQPRKNTLRRVHYSGESK